MATSFQPHGGFRQRMQQPARRGVILVLSGSFLTVMLIFSAFAIDLGMIVLTMSELQNAADAAALSAVMELKATDATQAGQLEARANAARQAKIVAYLNTAANRPVFLTDADIQFGNRHYDVADQRWVSTYDDPNNSEWPTNSVSVRVAFDGASSAVDGGGPVQAVPGPALRQPLALAFARVLGITHASVVGESRAHITPRDLVFCIDLSGSMSYDTPPGNNYDFQTALRPLLFPFMLGSFPADSVQQAEATTPNYQALWESTHSGGTWGDATQRAAFDTQEFGDCPHSDTIPQYWLHWKWRAYADYSYATSSNTSTSAYSNGLMNKNVLAYTSEGRRFSYSRYCRFLIRNGLVPAIRGQRMLPRDADQNGVLDTFPAAGMADTAQPYPTHVAYYPRPAELTNFDATLLLTNHRFTGVYPGSVQVEPMATVRTSALFGLHAMVSDENIGQDAFDQVGLVSFATLAHRELELTNDVNSALRVATNRLTMGTGGGTFVANVPVNASTNIGMALRQAIQMVKYSPRSRSWTNKTIALLTDGVPNVSPSAGNTGSEIQANGSLALASNGTSYAQHWAAECAQEGIMLHTIGVGSGANAFFLRGLSEPTGGVHFQIDQPESQQAELKEIFIAIGKDKLGKIYSD